MICKYCKSNHLHKDGKHNGLQRYKCLDCHKKFDGETYTGSNVYIEHFGVKIKDKPTNKLTRDNYCNPTNKTGSDIRKSIERAEFIKNNGIRIPVPSYYLNLPNKYFIDKNTYTDSYVEQHYKDCMYNYDLNIKYFNSLNKKDFDKVLDHFLKENKLEQIFNLNDAAINGIYLLVLDGYKQVYIGISNNIKRRILSHWSHRKEFERLIFGSKETSVLSIDSFGALDTTRIYIKKINWEQDINKIEKKMVAGFDGRYSLNRIAGGLNDDTLMPIKELLMLSSTKKRSFQKEENRSSG